MLKRITSKVVVDDTNISDIHVFDNANDNLMVMEIYLKRTKTTKLIRIRNLNEEKVNLIFEKLGVE